MSSKTNGLGEGNYEASRTYNAATKKFVESGRVEAAAKAAAPRSDSDAREMLNAERAALLHANTAQPRKQGSVAPTRKPEATTTSPSDSETSAVRQPKA